MELFKINKKDIEICILSKYFKLPYCSTCHSSQGSMIDEEITTFDCNSVNVDKNYIWATLTRTTNLNKVTICALTENEIGILKYCK